MPFAAAKPCKVHRCSGLCRDGSGWCLTHRPEMEAKRETIKVERRRAYQQTDERKAAKRFYDSAIWRGKRQAKLREQPLCEACQRLGRFTPATHVDHVIPWDGDRALALADANLQSMCAPCHSRKTATQDGGFGNTKPAP